MFQKEISNWHSQDLRIPQFITLYLNLDDLCLCYEKESWTVS